jgi:protein-L-isoaspartate(D-aspartate) O-methyltransferase
MTDISEDAKYRLLREQMVKIQIERRGITCPDVLRAIKAVPRHEFVPGEHRQDAYEDYPLPIGEEQTISQPYIVGYMTEALEVKKGDKILEVGTGSGYQAAVLAEMGAKVFSIEIIESLGTRVRELLSRLGYDIHVFIGDGSDGVPSAAPFDGIIVTAAPKKIPPLLLSQLKEGGRLVIPVGGNDQVLMVYTKKLGELRAAQTLPVRFVPMTGKAL